VVARWLVVVVVVVVVCAVMAARWGWMLGMGRLASVVVVEDGAGFVQLLRCSGGLC
jgi:hypothetical protein